jgi:general secretion pathway protein L
LPKRAADFLYGIVNAQIDRLTPWSAHDAIFGWSVPTEAASDRIVLTVVATARTVIAPYLQALAGLGAQSIVVSTIPDTGQADVAPVTLLEHDGQRELGIHRLRYALATAFVVLAISAGFAVAAGQLLGRVLQAEAQELSRQISDYRAAVRRAGSGAPSEQRTLDRRKRETPSTVMVIEALSQILPDHTYVTELRIEGDKLQVIGVTHDAPSLIRLIEQSPHFSRATFFAPTTRSASDPGERFSIEARIKPVFNVRT